MSCEVFRERLELTIGRTVAARDVGLDDAAFAELEGHIEGCAGCRALDEEIADTAVSVERALATAAVGATEELAGAVLERLGAVPRLRPPVRLFERAAAVLVGLAACLALWVAAGSTDREPGPPDLTLRPMMTADRGAFRTGWLEGYDGPRFRDVATRAGVDCTDHTGMPGEKDWMVETVGHGAAVFDMDGDGDVDLFVPDGNRFEDADRVKSTWRLYRNDGDLRFTDVTAKSGLDHAAWACGAVAGDLDADGRPDLYVACFDRNLVFRNLGDGRFEDVSEKSGAQGAFSEWSTAAALGDVDGDGDLDLYVANYADMRAFIRQAGEGRGCTWRTLPVACGPQPLPPLRDRLYLNNGDLTFEDATDERLPVGRRYAFQPVIVDLNGDGALDVFIASDAHANQLLLNDGTGHFTDDALAARVAGDGDGREQACMGVASGDFDGDGHPDLFVTNFSHEPNVLYRARAASGGVPEFADATKPAGAYEPGFFTLGWGVGFTDFDCDGDLDAMVANGHLYPGVEDVVANTSYAQHLSVLRNDGRGRFEEISASTGDDVVRLRVHRGLVVADFDDDGYPDAFVTVLNGRSLLLHNDGRGAGNSLKLVLRLENGVEAAGSRVTLRVPGADRPLIRDLVLGSSFASSEDPRLHVGLGAADHAAELTVRWPGGASQTFGRLDAGGVYELREGRAEPVRLR